MLLGFVFWGIDSSTLIREVMPVIEKMVEPLLTTLSMENSTHLSTMLTMDSSSLSHEEIEREVNRAVNLLQPPPDINLPLSVEPSPPPPLWNEACEMLDVSIGGVQHYEAAETQGGIEMTRAVMTKIGKKCAKRLDSVWGAWFFFNFYFKPVLNEKSKSKITKDNSSNCVNGYDKSDLKLDVFLVQHDMENIYMWVFKERPENALGKMQLRSYMNGHSRQGERQFPFSAEKGFIRSHRMQRKHYRGLSNPQCLHGIEVVQSPNLSVLDEDEQKKWMELTGRDLNFSIPLEASDFGSWRNVPHSEFEPLSVKNHHPIPQTKKLLNGSILNLSTPAPNHVNGDGLELLEICSNKRKKSFFHNGNDDDWFLPSSSSPDNVSDTHTIEPPWLCEFSGVMRNNKYGPVTAAKTIYEDDQAFLIIVSMPFADLERVKVTWRNTLSHGIVKISCVSSGCMAIIKRHDRTFSLTDPTPEHCPLGEFIREIPLPNRIPEDANLEAYGDSTGTMLEILVPKHRAGPEEHEVRVCLRPSPRTCDDLA